MIAALGAITAVVIVTMVYVGQRGFPGAQTSDASAPTAVSILQKPRTTWAQIAPEFAGAEATLPPVPCAIIDERTLDAHSYLSLTPALTFVCDEPALQARPIAPGRVVMAVTQPPLNSTKATILADGADGPWIRAAKYGPFVAVDHGTLNGVANVTTIYAGLQQIDENISLGQYVDSSTPLGTLGAKSVNGELAAGVLTFEFITDDKRFGSDPLRKAPPPLEAAAQLADLVADSIHIPTKGCTLPFGIPEMLVGSPREYRSGVHNGIDFGCFSNESPIWAAGKGQVLFVVNNHQPPSKEDRDSILAQTKDSHDTPFWTLAHVYGNFVVIDHRLNGEETNFDYLVDPAANTQTPKLAPATGTQTANSSDADNNVTSELDAALKDGVLSHPARAVTIYAHLDSVAEGIVPGAQVDETTIIGQAGNTGTTAQANGIYNNHNSVHLHWELHVDDRPIGYLDSPAITGPLYAKIICPNGVGEEPCKNPN